MPAFAPNWTGRLKISYFAAKAVHTQTWRFPGPSSGSGVTDLVTTISAYFAALQDDLWEDFVVNAVTVADIDSSIFLPIPNPFTGVTGGQVMTTFSPDDKAKATTWVGRSTGGHPWKITQYGVNYDILEAAADSNYRLLRGEDAVIDATLDALAAGAGSFLANDANSVAIYDYANIKPNDRWVKKVRRGS